MNARAWRAVVLLGLVLLGGCSSGGEGTSPAPPEREQVRTPGFVPAATVATAPSAASLAGPQPKVQLAGRLFEPDQLIVKYRAGGALGVTEDVARWVADGASFAGATVDASASLDGVHRRLGVRSARSLLPGRYGVSTSAAQRLLAQRGAAVAARAARANQPHAQHTLGDLANVYVLELAAGTDVLAAANDAGSDPHVEYAQPNYVMKADLEPNDPYFSSRGSWGQPYDDLWNMKLVHGPEAWDIEQAEGVVVGVVDTGLDVTHPDMAGNVWENPDEIPGNGIDDDGNGYIDDVSGWAFDDQTPNPVDGFGHGTHVAGTIAAVGNNANGVIGLAPKAKILPVRGLASNGYGSVLWLVQSMLYAAQNGARVINNSWGCVAGCPSSPLAEDAAAVAEGLGAVVVFAAGNSYGDIQDFSPQNDPHVIVVTASDPLDQRATFSNSGNADVSAPGSGFPDGPPDQSPQRGILSLKSSACSPVLCPPELLVGDGYLRQSGTSMAAPHVSALAALIVAQHPDYTPEEVRQVIRKSARDTGALGFDTDSGYGRIEAAAALATPRPLAAQITGPRGIVQTSADLTVTGSALGTGLASYRLEWGAGAVPTSYTLIASGSSAVADGTLGIWHTAAVLDGPQTLRLTVTSSSGEQYEDRQVLTFDRVFITEPTPLDDFTGSIRFYRAGAVIEVRGTAAAGEFASYDLSILHSDGSSLRHPRITLPDRGGSPVENGLLGTWDTRGVTADGYQIVLTVHSTSGGTDTDSVTVAVDPTLHEGWPLSLILGPDGYAQYTNVAGELTAVDLDGDGRVELASPIGRELTFIMADGGNLAGWPQTVDPSGYGYQLSQAPAVADVTGEGAPEVIGVNTGGELFLWHADGELLAGPVAANAAYAAADDMDGDGVIDIVTTGRSGNVAVWSFDGDTLVPWFEHAFGDGLLCSPPALGDVDGDGKKEIAVTVTDPYVGYTGKTDLYLLDSRGVMHGWPQPIHDGSGYAYSYGNPVVGDLEGNGKLAVVMGSPSGKLFAFRANGRNVPGWPVQVTTETSIETPALGDFDGDGKLDVVAGSGDVFVDDGQTSLVESFLYAFDRKGLPFAGFPHQNDYPSTFSFFGFGAALLADVDGDGRPEAVASTEGAADPYRALTAVMSDGSTVPGFPKLTTSYSPDMTNTAAVADFDGDGKLELAFLDAEGLAYLWDLGAAARGPRPWPMYQHDPQHTARADTPTSLRVRARGNQGSATDDHVAPVLRVLNDGSSDVSLAEVTLRYWYTDETAPSPQLFELDSATNEANGRAIPDQRVTARFGAVQGKSAERYVEVGFTSNAGKLKAGSAVALAFEVRAKSKQRYDEKDDYSYRRSGSEADWPRVTAYRAGRLVWGSEP